MSVRLFGAIRTKPIATKYCMHTPVTLRTAVGAFVLRWDVIRVTEVER